MLFRSNLQPDKLAVSVPINDVTGVSGFVRPGDAVDVLLTRQIPGDNASGSDRMTDVVMQAVRVLAIDQAIEVFAQARVAARAIARFQQRVERAVEFGLGALEVADGQFFLAGFKVLVRLRDQDGDRVRMGLE